MTLTDANQKGAIFVLGSQQQLLGLHAVDVPVVPPAQRGDKVGPTDRAAEASLSTGGGRGGDEVESLQLHSISA